MLQPLGFEFLAVPVLCRVALLQQGYKALATAAIRQQHGGEGTVWQTMRQDQCSTPPAVCTGRHKRGSCTRLVVTCTPMTGRRVFCQVGRGSRTAAVSDDCVQLGPWAGKGGGAALGGGE